MKLPAQGLLVADAGPLIILAKCDQLHLLTALFSTLHLPQAVVQEVLMGGDWPEIPGLREFIKLATVHESIDDEWVEDLRIELHEGEIQAMALARKFDALVLMDEAHGRRVAARNSVALIGTLGVLLRAKLRGLIPLIRPVVEQMKQGDYTISQSVVEQALRQAGETY